MLEVIQFTGILTTDNEPDVGWRNVDNSFVFDLDIDEF